MAIRIEIKDDHISDLLSFYVSKQKNIHEQISKLENELRDVNATLAQLRQRPLNISDPFTSDLLPEQQVYSAKWTWLRKISYAIKEAGKPVTTKQIVEILEAYEPKLVEERKTAISSVSSTLSVKAGKFSDKKCFVKSINESGEYAYDIWNESLTLEKNQSQYGSQITMDDLPF